MSNFTGRAVALLALVITFQVINVNAFAITGFPDQVLWSGERPVRNDIAEFYQSGPAFDLYIQGLQNFTLADQDDFFSFFQITGICHPCGEGHRPFLSLYERTLYDRIQVIASTYPADQIDAYQAAAEYWRIPYWDWSTSPQLPSVTTTPNITIDTPNGNETIANPLYKYDFHPRMTPAQGVDSGDLVSTWGSSVRYPDSLGNSNNAAASSALMSSGASVHVNTYQLLATQSNYTIMSTNMLVNELEVGYTSLEGLHDTIHTLTGGPNGHMNFIQWSAFDPIFWLHHANVDRLFAIWQALYPDNFITPEINRFGTYTESPGTIEGPDTPLTPFHKDDAGNFWTPQEVRWTRVFGYTYPEVIDWDTNATALAQAVRANVNALLNPTGSISPGNPSVARIKTSSRFSPRTAHGYNDTSSDGPMTIDMVRAMGVNNLPRQWSVDVRVNRSAIPSTFLIQFFLSEPPSDPTLWAHASNLIGTHGVLKPASQTGADTTMVNRGTVPLTHVLAAAVQSGTLKDLEPTNVVPMLSEQLQWRIQSSDNCPWNATDVAGLEVVVVCQPLTPTTSTTEFPVYGAIEQYHDVTAGKAGGSRAYVK